MRRGPLRIDSGVALAGLALATAIASGKPIPDVGAALSTHPSFWEQDRLGATLALQADGGRWDAASGRLAFAQAMRFGALECPSSVLWFEAGRPVRWEGSLFDRTKKASGEEAAWRTRFVAATNAMTAWAGSAPMAMVRPDDRSALVWGRAPHIVSVEWSPRSPEGPTPETDRLRMVAEPWPPRRPWAKMVRKTLDGDRFLAVPMVDQKVQGFCAPATVERLMRHYGIPLDAASMGQLAESSPDAGTNVQRLLEKLAQIRELRCEITELFGFDVRRFDRLIDAYNALASRRGFPVLSYPPPVLDLSRVFLAADPETLRAAAARQRDRRRFWNEVQRSVEEGHPLLWGVVLGLVPEPGIPAQTRGGHLRLIVGYNPKRQEVLFSDSWGPGHECKRLPLDDAWTMTMTLHTLVPIP